MISYSDRAPGGKRMLARLIILAAMPVAGFAASSYVQHNLVSDIPGLADQTDPSLVNPWGIATAASSPFWISDNHSGIVTVYNGTGQPFPATNPLAVTIPAPPTRMPPS